MIREDLTSFKRPLGFVIQCFPPPIAVYLFFSGDLSCSFYHVFQQPTFHKVEIVTSGIVLLKHRCTNTSVHIQAVVNVRFCISNMDHKAFTFHCCRKENLRKLYFSINPFSGVRFSRLWLLLPIKVKWYLGWAHCLCKHFLGSPSSTLRRTKK